MASSQTPDAARQKRILVAKENRDIVMREHDRIPYTYTIGVDLSRLVAWQERHATEAMPKIEFYNGSTNQAIRYYVGKGHGVLAMNFANAFNPGGGYTHGATAQEEELCRTAPFLHASLEKSSYPFGTFASVKYTPNVNFIRKDGIESNGEYTPLGMGEVYNCSIVTAAAPNLAMSGEMLDLYKRSPSVVYQKMRHVIQTVYLSPKITSMMYQIKLPPVDVLVIGAWGCGAFRPDNVKDHPTKVAELFRSALHIQPGFRGLYKKICFAIPGGDNYQQFYEVFKNLGVTVVG
jgi:uncharacterized protein (TIGR02452 family)